MKLSKRLKSKLKKNLISSLAITAAVTTMLATFRLTGLFMPFGEDIKTYGLQSQSEEIEATAASYGTKISNSEKPQYQREDISTLDDILIDGVSLDRFKPNKLNYKIFVEKNSAQITVVKTNEGQLVTGIGTISLPSKTLENEQYFEIQVTSADKTNTTTYRIYYQFGSKYISTKSYNCTKGVQEYYVEKPGYYKMQLWGAAGGSVSRGASSSAAATGGKGGYTEGKIYLDAGTRLYVYVGEYYNGYKNEECFNGGGRGSYSSNSEYNANGGGATDIRLEKGNSWSDFESLKSRIMVAAGAGGASNLYSGITGGYAGGLTGGNGNYSRADNVGTLVVSKGATQTEGGLGANANPEVTRGTLLQGSFGKGGSSINYTSSWIYYSGGGGGYYGGGAGGAGTHIVGSAAGGSSFISGYNGCDAITEDSTKNNIIHTGQAIHYSGKYYINSVMYAGNQSMPNTAQTGNVTGNPGTGYATIRFLDEVANDTRVSNLITDKGTIVEPISVDRDTYTIRLLPDEYKVNLKVTTLDPFCIVNQEELENLIIPAGASTRNFTVTAQDGTTKQFTINFERQASNINYIDGITVNERYYKFTQGKFQYDIELPYNEEYADIQADWIRPSQIITGAQKYDIENDQRTVILEVLAEDGVTRGTYTINFRNEHCNYLKAIEFTGIALSEVFNPEKFEYKLALTSRYNSLEIDTKLWDPEASVTIEGNHNLKLGDNKVKITVHEPNIAVDAVYTLTVKITNDIKYTYDYTGDYQSFVAPLSGYYNIKLWGAAGGTMSGIQGGKGAYTEGEIYLEAGTVLYIYIGENYNGYKQAQCFNGGGNGSYSKNKEYNANGGGATDIRLVKGDTWSDFDSLKSRIMVAAGGGGASNLYGGIKGGNAGALTGDNGSYKRWDYLGSLIVSEGGTQTKGGLGARVQANGTAGTIYQGAFGVGGYNNRYTSDWIYYSGGGGGYYGGGTGGAGTHIVGSGAGGSSFISGYEGCDAITEDSTKEEIIHTGQSVHYSGRYFRNAVMYSGNDTFLAKTGNGTTTGNTGNGYAMIEYIEPKLMHNPKEITIQVNQDYTIDKQNLKIVGNNDLVVGDLSFSSSNQEVITVDENGVITPVKIGKAKIEITDTTNNLTTYIYVTVTNGAVLDIKEGQNFTIALKQNGTVWSYGLNNKGQLGLGNSDNVKEPTQVIGVNGVGNLKNIKQIEVGTAHSIALDEKGNVYTWGDNSKGQLGNGENSNENKPIRITGLSNIIKIDAYKNISSAIDEEGRLYVWGEGYSKTPSLIDTDFEVSSISGTIVLSTDGEVYNLSNLATPIKGLKGISKISCGKDHYLALTTDGIVLAWGDNTYGELGTDKRVVSGEIVEVIDNIFDISAGNDYSIFRSLQGEVYVTGNSTNGQMGLGGVINAKTPTKVENLQDILAISAGEATHSSVVDIEGFVLNTGLNTYGELGTKDNTNKKEFSRIGGVNILTKPERITVEAGKTSQIVLTSCYSFNLITDIPKNQISNTTETNEKIAQLNKIINVDNSNIANIDEMIPNYVVSGNTEGRCVVVVSDEEGNKANLWINVVKDENAIVASKVETGKEFSVSLRANGEVYTWGQNSNGELGLGDKQNRNIPFKVDVGTNIIEDISVGTSHSLLLSTDGNVYSFGLNSNGQLGIGNTATYTAPVQISNLKDIKKVIACQNTSFAINKDGKVYAWGEGYTKAPTQLNIDKNVIDITKTYYLADDGIVRKISNNNEVLLSYNENDPTEPIEIVEEQIVQISEGKDHLLLLGKSKIVYSLGQNVYGQLGDGTTVGKNSNITTAVRISEEEKLSNIVKVSAGDRYSIAQGTQGEVYLWGKNEAGELGQNPNVSAGGLQESSFAIEKADIQKAVNISAGFTHSTISKTNGEVYTFGKGETGQLGNGTNSNFYQAQLVGKNIIETNTNEIVMEAGETLNIDAWINYFNLYEDKTGQLSLESLDNSRLLVDNQTGNIMALREGRTTILVKENGTNKIGVIQVRILEEGTNPSTNKVKIEPQVAVGGSHTVTLKVDGTVWCYGQNTYGQLGNGTTDYSDEPTKVVFPEGTVITKIAAGQEHSMAQDIQGNVWVWGRNQYYQLGNNSNGYTNVPIKITNLPQIIDIDCGPYTSYVITKDKEVYSFGLNANGEGGIGSYTNKITVTKAKILSDIIDIKAGKNGTIALKSTGEVYVTGSNLYGELGNGSYDIKKQNVFTKIESLENIVAIGAGDSNNLALNSKGEVFVWGSNLYKELGINSNDTSIPIPTKVYGVNNIRYVEGGKNTSALVNSNGDVYVAGLNRLGGLGNNTQQDISEFEKLTTISNVIDISLGDNYSGFVKNDGTVWGSGDYNHGDTSLKSKTKGCVPIQVGNNETGFDKNEILLNIDMQEDISTNLAYEFNLIDLNSDFKDKLTYTSLNTNIAEVSNQGTVTGKKEGTTWVKAISTKNNQEYIVKVNVVPQGYIASPKVEAGRDFAVVLKGDGSIWTFGYNSNGELSDGTNITKDIPEKTNILSTFSKISAGESFFIALRNDNTVWASGKNDYGQLGNNTTKSKNKLIQINGIQDVKKISAGKNHAVILDSYGLVYGWGDNSKGQLGKDNIGKNTLSPVFVENLGQRIIDIQAGEDQTILITAKGEVYGMGSILDGYLAGVNNAQKVQVGNGYLLILTKDNKIYKYDGVTLSSITGVENAIDIDVKNNVNMYQSIDEKTYTWGENTYGQLGNNQTTDTAQPELVNANGNNTYSIGAGINNTYIIENTGFVFASGNNEYGALGNSTRDNSSIHTLVGNREFKILPETKTMVVNDKETPSIESDTFNVFRNTSKEANQYTWVSDNTDIVEVIQDGKLQALAEGTANITVTDKITGKSVVIQRFVEPMDRHRVESIRVDNIDATAQGYDLVETDVMTYNVKIETDENTGILVVKTIDATDKISLNQNNWVDDVGVGTLAIKIDLPTKITKVPIYIQTTNETVIKYILTVEKVSKDVGIKKITVTEGPDVTNPTNIITAIPVDLTTYEAVVSEDTVISLADVVTNNENAYVSIDGTSYVLEEQTKNIIIGTALTKEVKIVVKSESGKEQEYTLTIYKESEFDNLEKVTVNGKEATKINEGKYSINMPTKLNTADIYAKAISSQVEVSIENNTYKLLENTNKVNVTQNPQEVIIKLKLPNGTIKEYSLDIYQKEDEDDPEADKPLLDMVIVNGNICSVNFKGEYEAFLPSAEQTATVRAIAKDITHEVKISTNSFKLSESEETVSTSLATNTYTIEVKSPEGIKQYTLIIRKAEADTSLKEIYVQNGQFTKQASKKSELIYEVKVPNSYTDFDVTAITGYINSEVIINDIGNYQKNNKTQNVILNTEGNTTSVSIKVKSEDGQNETEYTLNIIKMSNDTSLEVVKVNDVEATYNEQTGEYTVYLTTPETKVNVYAKTTSEISEVKINANSYDTHETTKEVVIDSKQTKASITVKAEDGSLKTYTLNIEGLPDNTNILKVVVNGVNATYKDGEYIYEVRLDASSYNIEVTLDDLLAKITLGAETEKTGTSTTTVTKQAGTNETIVDAIVTAQNGIDKQSYKIVIKDKSNNSGLDKITVNGIKVNPDSQGNYKASIKHSETQIEVVAIAEDDLAITTINSQTNNNKQMQVIENTVDGKITYTYEIIVKAEDNTTSTYHLEVKWLDGNNNLLKVNVSEDNNTYAEAQKLEDGTYYYKVNRIDKAYVKLDLESNLASATINGQKVVPGNGIEVALSDEITTSTIIVTAEDGTTKNYILNIEKKSKDTKLKEITGQGVVRTIINEKDAYIYVDEDITSIDLTYVLNNENASIKLGEETTYVKAQMTKHYDLTKFSDKVLFIELNIMSESGDEVTYIAYLYREANTNVKTVKVNNEEVTYDEKENRYYKIVANPNEPIVEITADNLLQTVELLDEAGNVIKTGTGTITSPKLTLNTEKLETNYIIRIISHRGESLGVSEYPLVIRQKSKDYKIEYIKVDDRFAIEGKEEYTYIVDVSGKETYPLEIKTKDANTTIKIEDEEGKLIKGDAHGILNTDVSIPDGESKSFKITVVSENGEQKEYTLTITRISSNTEIEEITVEDYDTDGQTKIIRKVTSYNKTTKTYAIVVNKELDISNVVVKAQSSFSEVTLDDIKTDTQIVDIDKTLSGLGINTVKIYIKAANGADETRYLNIIQLSNEIGLEKLEVDDVELTADEAGNYEVTLTDETDLTKIYAKAKSELSSVSINSLAKETLKSTRNVSKGKLRQLVVPITVIAEDDTSYTYTLIINIISHDTTTEYVKVDGTKAELVNGEYQAFIDAIQTTTQIEVKPGVIYSSVIMDAPDISDLNKPDFTCTYTIKAEDGTTKEYTIHLIRKSTKNDIESLYVDGKLIDPDDDGKYYATVTDGALKALVKVVANNQYAKVEFDGANRLQELEKNVDIDQDNKITQIEIFVTSQQGAMQRKVLNIERISNNFELDYVKVNTELAEVVTDKANTFVSYIYETLNEVSIDIGSKNQYAKVEQVIIDEETGEITAIRSSTKKLVFDLYTPDKITTIYFRILAEDGKTSSQIYTLNIEKMSTDTTLKELYVNGELIEKNKDGKYVANVLDKDGTPQVKAITNHDLAYVRITLQDEHLHIAEGPATLSSEKETVVPITVRSQSGLTKVTYLYITVISTSVKLEIVKVDDKDPLSYDEVNHIYEMVVEPDKEDYELFLMAESSYANIEYDKKDYGSSLKKTIHMDSDLEGMDIKVKVTSENGEEQEYTILLIRKSINTDLEYLKVDGIERNPTEENGSTYEVMIGKLQKTASIEVRTSYKYASIRLSDNQVVRNAETATVDCDLKQEKIIVPVVVTAPDGKTTRTYNVVLVRGSNDTSIILKVEDTVINSDDKGDYKVTINGTKESIKVEAISQTVGTMGKYASIDLNTTGVYGSPSKKINFEKEDLEGKDILVIPIEVIAEDGTKRENILTIEFIKKTSIKGKIITENVIGEHYSEIKLYKTSDTRKIDDEVNPREVVKSLTTNKDGSFEIIMYTTNIDEFIDENGNKVADVLEEAYDLVVTKNGYLSYTVKNIILHKDEDIIIEDYNLIAGDVVVTGEIEIDDLVALNDNYGVSITEGNKESKAIYDLNEDGVVDNLDREILIKNYGKQAETLVLNTPKVKMMSQKKVQQNFILPMACDYYISSEYGTRIDPITGEKSEFHRGIDIVGEHHTNILAIADGEVTFAGVQNGYGNCIEIKHIVNGETIYSFYAHLSKIDVEKGQEVKQGEVIGLEGGAKEDENHGSSTGHHLHFELRTKSLSKDTINPREYIKF